MAAKNRKNFYNSEIEVGDVVEFEVQPMDLIQKVTSVEQDKGYITVEIMVSLYSLKSLTKAKDL